MTDAAATPKPTARPGQRAPRTLEAAPLLLRKASKVLILGATLPWITAVSTQGHVPWGYWAGSVALVYLAGWILIEGVKARRGLKANGAVAKIAGMHAHAAALAALVVFLGACAVAWLGNAWFAGDPEAYVGTFREGASDRYSPRAILELATLFLGLATYAHILDYEHGAKFNPVFPLMFLGPAVAGALQVFGAFGEFSSNTSAALISLVGSITVAAGGAMAIYTMYVSMKQAKVEGDLKRAEQRERRKSERSAGGGAPRRERP